MPQLSDLLEKKKKFVKKNFRPWDLSGTGTIDQSTATPSTEGAANAPANDAPAPTQAVEKTKIKQIPTAYVAVMETSAKTGNETGNKTDNKQVTTREQTGNEEVTTKQQQGNNKVTTREQTDNETGNVTGNIYDVHYLTEAVKKLSGIQKNIFLYIIKLCAARGTLDTGNLLAIDLANAANCTTGSAKTSLIRLVEKQVVIRHPGKASRGGHMVLGITREIQAAAIQAQQALFNPLKMGLSGNETGNNTDNNSSYSSSINKNITTTSLPDDWKRIDFEPLAKIGFTETQLRQLLNCHSTSPEIVQESIFHFAFALEHKEKIKAYSEPLNVLMGVLRKGQIWHEADYISPQELSLQTFLDDKRKRKEKMDAMIKELVDLEFPEWRKQLTEDDVKQIVPAHTLKANVTTAIQAALRSYFMEKILFPRLEKDGLISKTFT